MNGGAFLRVCMVCMALAPAPLPCLLQCPVLLLLLPISNFNAVATPSLRISFVVVIITDDDDDVCLLLLRIRLPAHPLQCRLGEGLTAVQCRPIQPNAEGTQPLSALSFGGFFRHAAQARGRVASRSVGRVVVFRVIVFVRSFFFPLIFFRRH